MGEANFYYFTCLKEIQLFLLCQNGYERIFPLAQSMFAQLHLS